jgi:hypothetical protein
MLILMCDVYRQDGVRKQGGNLTLTRVDGDEDVTDGGYSWCSLMILM